MMVALSTFIKLFLVLALCFAWQTITPSTSIAASITTTETASYFRLIWGLLVVLGVMLIIYGIVKKRFSMFSASASQNIQILEIRPMMGKKALCLVDVKGQEYLLGISGDSINHIATLPPIPPTSFSKTLETETEKQESC